MADIRIDVREPQGKIKALHGVNNGPVCYGALIDVSDYYREAEIPLVRIHDPNWPHAWEVDIHTIFPDFSKDAADPANYDFSRTDEYLQTILDTGAKIVYRLGESIEHTKKKYYVHPPGDYGKWTEICVNIIRHYNEGWADGFHHGIDYWEVWNEPDLDERMWSGTPLQLYELYEATVKAIKAYNPALKVGGYAAARPKLPFLTGFLAYCQERKLPIDFFTWHTYTGDPHKIVEHAHHVRTELDRHGYTATESHLNEWNYLETEFTKIWNRGNEYVRKSNFDKQKNAFGAAFTGTVLTLLQDCPVDEANYYDGQPTALFCGLFDYHGVPQKTYYTFKAFQRMTKHAARVRTVVSDKAPNVYGLAGLNGEGGGAALITSFGGTARLHSISLEGLEGPCIMKIYTVDDDHRLDLREERVVEGAAAFERFLPSTSVTLLEWSPAK
ncbi:GH39 family glycosyl hydrolase [Paenibacillus sp. MBLB4367]|uniref:GH39 family glycosyl hydrolase n=1 Tax=Paenibacillus sp. MBLB4367 TaxID=3384767 RepID=UPI003907E9A2